VGITRGPPGPDRTMAIIIKIAQRLYERPPRHVGIIKSLLQGFPGHVNANQIAAARGEPVARGRGRPRLRLIWLSWYGPMAGCAAAKVGGYWQSANSAGRQTSGCLTDYIIGILSKNTP
jgi:hypothetical protein